MGSSARNKARERATARSLLPIDLDQLESLLDHLEARDAAEQRDRGLTLTTAWARDAGVEPEGLAAGLRDLGGYCDCEVLANIDLDELR